MKNLKNFAIILGLAAFLFACGGNTEVAWKNGRSLSEGSDTGDYYSIGDITWEGDSKNNTWNPIDTTGSSTSGALKVTETSESLEVERTTSDVSGWLYTGGWAEANANGISLNEGQQNLQEITMQGQ